VNYAGSNKNLGKSSLQPVSGQSYLGKSYGNIVHYGGYIEGGPNMLTKNIKV
jgi:hypothetical protein